MPHSHRKNNHFGLWTKDNSMPLPLSRVYLCKLFSHSSSWGCIETSKHPLERQLSRKKHSACRTYHLSVPAWVSNSYQHVQTASCPCAYYDLWFTVYNRTKYKHIQISKANAHIGNWTNNVETIFNLTVSNHLYVFTTPFVTVNAGHSP